MRFDKIILCTDAPRGQGLAYYYYRAFCDEVGVNKVSIVDDGERNYGASVWERGVRRLKHEMGFLSVQKYQSLLMHLVQGSNLVILFNNSDLQPKEIKALSENQAVYLANYLSDHPYAMIPSRQREVIQCIPLFDLICTFAQDLVPVIYQLGAKKVERIPFGYCRYTHAEPAKNISIEFPDKVFYFGTWTPEIEEWVSHLTRFDLQIEGNSWQKARRKDIRDIGTKKKPNTDSNMSIMARKAGVVVNFTRAKHGCFHTMKTFELTVAGACVVSNFSDEQNEFFKSNESMAYFNTHEEMINQVRYYLENGNEAKRIRDNALKEAIRHSYHDRCMKIISLFENDLW